MEKTSTFHLQWSHPFPESVVPHLTLHTFRSHEFVITEGDAPQYLYYIVEGKAKVYFTQQNGKVALLHFVTEGAFIGDMEMLDERYESKGVQAATTLKMLALPIHMARQTLLTDALFLRQLCTYMSRKIMHNSAKMSQSLAYPLENRLAEFLLMSQENRVYNEKHTEVAAFLGVSYRHLLYVFAQFVDRGLIEKDGKQYVLKDVKALTRMATSIFKTPIHDID
ncbi:transcriptional regulator YeiL [Kurthia massiliensis]|uniref:transcriptional regulator YeiL n=1 Tax=Kurthia massiliensis TaxID=1033739 RepID=UPI000287C053|nr:transcriptional regulator YeiL [Kurthia massiliensis]